MKKGEMNWEVLGWIIALAALVFGVIMAMQGGGLLDIGKAFGGG